MEGFIVRNQRRALPYYQNEETAILNNFSNENRTLNLRYSRTLVPLRHDSPNLYFHLPLIKADAIFTLLRVRPQWKFGT